MKKTILLCLVLLFMFIPCLLMASNVYVWDSQAPRDNNNNNQTYYLNAEVNGFNQHGTILLLCERGNLWEVEGLDLREGESVVMVMDKNNTPNRTTDDIIINVYVMAREAQG